MNAPAPDPKREPSGRPAPGTPATGPSALAAPAAEAGQLGSTAAAPKGPPDAALEPPPRAPRPRVHLPSIRAAVAKKLPRVVRVTKLGQDVEGEHPSVVVHVDLPIFGGLSVLFGFASFLTKPWLFAPLAILFAILALFRGQTGFAVIGAVCAAAGLASSYVTWFAIAWAWLWGLI